MSIESVISIIQHGVIELEVPDGMDILDALQSYALNYPELSVAKLSEPEFQGNKMVYKVLKNDSVGTKG